MIPAGCIPVIITQYSITLAFKKQTSIDLLTHSMGSYNAQILPLYLHLQARREMISSPSLCKRFLFTGLPARLPSTPGLLLTLSTEIGQTQRTTEPRGIFVKTLKSKVAQANYRLLPPFYQGSPIFAFKVQIAQNMVLFCRL